MTIRIPVYEPLLDGHEAEYVLDCVRTGWISSVGKYVDAFEAAFARWAGAEHGIACSNGTVALHLALLALGVGPGDEVIIPDFTLIVSASMTILTGATPVAVDVDPETWCLDPEAVRRAIGPRTKVVMAVHMYGHPADLRALREICQERGVHLLVDGAESHGAEIDGSRRATLGEVSAFSFYGNKILTTGEGGMLLTDDARHAAHLRSLRNHCFKEPRFQHDELGFNYRLTNVQAAIGLAQVERADALVAAKRRVAARYLERLAGVPVQLPVERSWATNVYWMVGVVLPDEAPPREVVRERLLAAGVDTRAFFWPMSRQPALAGRLETRGDLSVSRRLGERGFYLPSSPGLDDAHIDEVAAALRAAVGA